MWRRQRPFVLKHSPSIWSHKENGGADNTDRSGFARIKEEKSHIHPHKSASSGIYSHFSGKPLAHLLVKLLHRLQMVVNGVGWRHGAAQVG